MEEKDGKTIWMMTLETEENKNWELFNIAGGGSGRNEEYLLDDGSTDDKDLFDIVKKGVSGAR